MSNYKPKSDKRGFRLFIMHLYKMKKMVKIVIKYFLGVIKYSVKGSVR